MKHTKHWNVDIKGPIMEERKMAPELAKGLRTLRWYLDSKESKGTKSDWVYRMKERNVLIIKQGNHKHPQ